MDKQSRKRHLARQLEAGPFALVMRAEKRIMNVKIKKIIGVMICSFLIVVVVWTAFAMNNYQMGHGGNIESFKVSCMDDGGELRHEYWLFGVVAICQMNGGRDRFLYKVLMR